MNTAFLWQAWMHPLLFLLQQQGQTHSPRKLAKASLWHEADSLDSLVAHLSLAAKSRLLVSQSSLEQLFTLPYSDFPVVVGLKDGRAAVLHAMTGSEAAMVVFDGQGKALYENWTMTALASAFSGASVRVAASIHVRDERLSQLLKPVSRQWFRRLLWQHAGAYKTIAVATFAGNLLAMATALFAMQVWDRVLPAQSVNTLWVLALGVLVALVFEYILRTQRASLTDAVGKQIGLSIGNTAFARMLDMQTASRPTSSASLMAQMREIDGVRDALTSTSVLALMDLPFVLIFFALIALIGGPLVYVALLAIPLLVLPGVIAQWPLARLAGENLKERSERNAILMAGVEQVEDIKLLQAEDQFSARWDIANRLSSATEQAQRSITNGLLAWSNVVQQALYTLILVAGVYEILAGHLSQGAVLACSILAGRALAPMGTAATIFTRLQQARVAQKSLDDLFVKPTDHDPDRAMIRREQIKGNYELHQVMVVYPERETVALKVPELRIQAEERIGVLGKTGAGKSTLLRLLSGLHPAQQGQILLDGAPLTGLDPIDLRRDVAYMSQQAGLFYGSLRDNLTMGQQAVSAQAIDQALHLSGAEALVASHPQGLDLLLHEGGAGLSGGQRQQLLLARLILRNPNVVLLDEPTAAMDELTERQLIERLTPWLSDKTLIIATHKPQVLRWVNRLLVVDRGQLVMSGPRDAVLTKLSPTSSRDNLKVGS